MPLLYATGELMNLLERAVVTLHGSATENPLYGVANLSDGRPALPMRFSSLLAEERIKWDLNQLINGDMELWSGGSPVGYTQNAGGGTGEVTETVLAGDVHGGTSAAFFDGGDLGVSLTRDFMARAGEKRRLTAWLKRYTGTISVKIRNLSTGREVRSDGVWDTTGTALSKSSGATYTEESISYTVESPYACGGDSVTLRVTVSVGATGTCVLDDLTDHAGTDLVSLHGFRVMDRCVIRWEVSDDGSSYTDAVVAGDHVTGLQRDQKPTLYLKRAATVYKRFHQVRFDNSVLTSVAPREIGELVACQVATMQRAPDWGTELKEMESNIRNEVGDGDTQSFGHGLWPRRGLVVRWNFPEVSTGASLTAMREARDELWARARGSRHNILIVPRTDENRVMLMRTEDNWQVRRQYNVYSDNDLVLTELPFGSNSG